MATLFRDFSFDAASPSLADHEAERALMNCSPTSKSTTPEHPYSRPLTPPPCTMSDLAQLMGGQNLFISTSRSQNTPVGPPTPPSEDDTFPTEQLDPHAPRPTYCRASASIMRMQRQANSRLQCCSSQARDISKLVRMIQEEEQCNVNEPAVRSASTVATVESVDDEGVDMDYDCSLRVTVPLFSRPLYRAGDRHNDNVRVSKNVRMRKRSSTAKETRERRKTK
ncbi:hypothetical protein BU25DRAFT_414805 [Macroventuria anomochaeta]|uniref:Uncharacterized protein n=1 Tax=Macroventuria anomochaeta TaxID=301207 RepID=A0ACB6RPG4_9PLEO|nr:uncharacterized protein BU25DRAFT_414805 [Macroventuria anomochaeta]KAF2623054.1 hypothetical protein BU25DRAFT_414805 [Macroventuria anomochaeta]